MARVVYIEPDVFRAPDAGVTAGAAGARPASPRARRHARSPSSSSRAARRSSSGPRRPGAVVAFWRMVIAVMLWWVVDRRPAGARPAARRRRPTTWRPVLPAGLLFGAQHHALLHRDQPHEHRPRRVHHRPQPAGCSSRSARCCSTSGPTARALPWGGLTLVGLAIVLFLGGSQGGATVGGDAARPRRRRHVGRATSSTGRQARATVDVVDFMTTMMPIGMLTATPIALILAGDELWPLTGAGAGSPSCLLAVLTGMLGHGLIAFAQREVDVGHDQHHPGRPAGARRRLGLPAARRGDPPGAGPRHGARASSAWSPSPSSVSAGLRARLRWPPTSTGSSRDQWAERAAAAADPRT